MKVAFFISALALVGAVACRGRAPVAKRQAGPRPSYSVVHPSATSLQPESSSAGYVGVQYVASIPYPADAFLCEIQAAATAAGFSPLPESWLNPGIPSSVYRGWSSYYDSTKTPAANVHMWQAERTNGSKDILSYSLWYVSASSSQSSTGPVPTPSHSAVNVTAGFIPSAMASAIKSQMPHR